MSTVHGPTTFHVTSADGTRIGGMRAGSGPGLVLVHGTASSSHRWEPIMPALAERYSLYVVDRRGRGESGDNAAYSLDLEAEDLVAVIEAASAPVSVFGHSYGGLVAIEAAMRTRAIHKLMLYEPPLPLEHGANPPTRIDIDDILATEGNESLLIRFFTEIIGVSPEGLEAMQAEPSWPHRVAAAPTLAREAYAIEHYHWDPERMAAISIPTKVLMGSLSPAFLTHSARAIRMAIPHATLSVFDGHQHAAMDTAPDLFLATVFDFIDI